MNPSYDVAIVGLGAMGSAAAFHLARRDRRVIGFDMYTPPHEFGSTHGQSRIIREAYFEHPLYVPFVKRAYENWQELQELTGETLLHQTGGLLIGPKDGVLVSGTRLSADRHGLDYDVLSARDVRKNFPVLHVPDDKVAIWEPRAGILFPEPCVESHLQLAKEHGADLHFDEPVSEWKPKGDGVRVTTDRGQYDAARLVLTPGAWMTLFVPDLELPLKVERQVLHWFDPIENEDGFQPGRLPIFAWEYDVEALFYGFPDLGEGVKVALHHQGIFTDIADLDRSIDEGEVLAVRALLAERIPDLNSPPLRSDVCMYTNTPDEHFLIDVHPRLPQVLIVSPCSGHGFKFASAIGEIIADLTIDGRTGFDLSPFRLNRFTST